MTQLQVGNRLLREGNFAAAVPCYLKALDEAPALRRFISYNLATVRQRHTLQRVSALQPHVGVLGLPDCPRAQALLHAWERSADAEWADWLPASAGNVEPFVGRTLQQVATHPLDVVHLVGASAPHIIAALLLKLLWGTRVLVDCGEQETPASGPAAALIEDGLPLKAVLSGRDWARIAAAMATHFDVVTVASQTLQQRFGGTVVPGPTMQALVAATAAAPSPLTPEGLRLLQALPLPPSLLVVLPGLATLQPSARNAAPASVEPAEQAAAAPTANPAKVSPPPPAAAPSPVPRAYRPPVTPVGAAAVASAAAWTRAADLQPGANAGVVEVLGQAVALATQEELQRSASDSAAARAFAALHGRAEDGSVTLRCRDGALVDVPGAAAVDSTLAAKHFRRRWNRSGVELADLWFTTGTTLRLRLQQPAPDAPASGPPVLRAFQATPGGGALRAVAESALTVAGPSFVDVPLLNALFPLLLVVTDPLGAQFEATLLPFPSLCRGGLHHAELAAIGEVADYMPNLEAVSNSLHAEFCGWPGALAKLALGEIEVDLVAATGSEHLFSMPVKQWLGEVMRLGRLTPRAGTDADAAPAAATWCVIEMPSPAATATRGSLVLGLGAQALPTIAALTSRRLALAAGSAAACGAWAVAHPVTARPRCIVSMPPAGDDLQALQPLARAAAMPLLKRREDAAAGGTTTWAPFPLTIDFPPGAPNDAAALLLPAGPTGWATLRRALYPAERAAAAITLVVLTAPDSNLEPLLASVARQTLAAAVDVVLALADAPATGAASGTLVAESLFPGRHRVQQSVGRTPSGRVNDAAAQARGSHLLLVDAATVLHDPRTLETLYTLAIAPGIASAACAMLREVAFKKGSEVRAFSAGMFPRQLSFQGRPTLVVDEPSRAGVLLGGTYPVIGNSFRLALVSRAVWVQLGGLDESTFPVAHADLDFCLRAQRAGFAHLCTGAITASHLGSHAADQHVDSHALSFMPLERWHDVLAGVTMMRDLEI